MAIDARKATGISIQTADAQVKSAPGYVYWVAASAGGTGGGFNLRDGTTDSDTAKLSITMAANSTQFFGPFDPPIDFATAIRADIPGTNVTINVCYT